MTAYRSKLSCGHPFVHLKKKKIGDEVFCPLHRKFVKIKQIEEGKIKQYIGFVPREEKKVE